MDHTSVSAMAFVILPRLLLPICFSLFTLPWAEAQTIMSSNAATNTNVEFVLTTISNQTSVIVEDFQKSNPPNLTASISVDQSASAFAAKVQSASRGMAKTTKLVIGIIVVGIVILILLVTMGLAYFCIVRKLRRERDGAAIAHQNTEGEGENPQLYFQQKAELDDEQRRHEIEAVEVRYEMDGEDEIHEMPVEEREKHWGRQELRGEEHSKELDNTI